ncbi:hypothetical protein BKA67DRAFT_550237 [Truncatella angustata]|uniref:Thioredoxin domain-containing protein n=1 Tax=Truncatella angustata TaxID=152316 RepID=A0A9P8UZA4_9PEZI|nr:uncharacterized protein BKA67DRAFT_550237 [Truncatella angustata]KAH6661122.1 hypothetical protein BKA67DRAFT_550237 [Truncatella angustata]KAH8202457.1 hypothetical protein TruAng_003357 [Truncatella angustata]
MSVAQELESWRTPAAKTVKAAPKPGERAPVNDSFQFKTDKPTLVVFLRHCGCPFAEKTFKKLTKISSMYQDVLHCVAVSHSEPESTERWVVQVGGNWEVQVVVDHEREMYAQWGMGISNTWHVLGPMTLYKTFQLGKQENVWNRPTESGNRWQTSGAFAVDKDGTVRWAKIATSAADMPDLDAALGTLGIRLRKRGPRDQSPSAIYARSLRPEKRDNNEDKFSIED